MNSNANDKKHTKSKQSIEGKTSLKQTSNPMLRNNPSTIQNFPSNEFKTNDFPQDIQQYRELQNPNQNSKDLEKFPFYSAKSRSSKSPRSEKSDNSTSNNLNMYTEEDQQQQTLDQNNQNKN